MRLRGGYRPNCRYVAFSWVALLNFIPKALKTQILQLLGLKTILCRAFGAVGNWVFDMQVWLSEMQKSCPGCKVFASRVAKPECRTTIFTGRPAVFASRVVKPECRTTIFTGRPDRLLFYYFTILLFYYFISIRFQAEVFASRVAKPECRTTIFTGRPDRLLFYYFTISFPLGSRQRFLHLG